MKNKIKKGLTGEFLAIFFFDRFERPMYLPLFPSVFEPEAVNLNPSAIIRRADRLCLWTA